MVALFKGKIQSGSSLQGCLDSGQVPEWMVKENGVDTEGSRQGDVVASASKYRPTPCLP